MNSNVDLVILAGGKGTRLKKYLNGTCKPLIKINGKPFLHYLLYQVSKYYIRNIIILAGYRGKQIYQKYNNKIINSKKIKCIIEKKPLGTGGALVAARNKISKKFFLINGDTIFNVNLNKILKIKLNNNHIFIALTKTKNKNKNTKLNKLSIKKNLIKFDKSFKYQNGGIYFLNKSILKNMKKNNFISFEDIIQREIKYNRVVGKYYKSFFLDIGTPKNLLLSKKKFFSLFYKVITNNYF